VRGRVVISNTGIEGTLFVDDLVLRLASF
jgi:hypothetical protein